MTARTRNFQLQTNFHRHVRRPDWGLAMYAGLAPSGKRYQFEDGQLRTIGAGYEHMMEDVGAPENAARRMVDLSRKLSLSTMKEDQLMGDGPSALLSTADQIELFKAEYPGAFRDPRWVKEVRGLGAKRATKKHRDASIAQAQALLSNDRLRGLLVEKKFQVVVDGLIEVLRGTNLVDLAKDVRPLMGLEDQQVQSVAEGLVELLHDSGDMVRRFDHFVVCLEAGGVTPTWLMVTAPLALLFPQRHVPVRPTSFRRQAKRMGFRLQVGSRPLGSTYFALLQLANFQQRDLLAAGLKPRDLLSIHDFVRSTTRPQSGRPWPWPERGSSPTA